MLIENLSELQREYMHAAKQALLKGDEEYAISLYQTVLKLVDEQDALSDPLIAECLTRMGNLFMDKGNYQKAEPYFRLALFVYGRCPGHWHSSMTLAEANLAYCSAKLQESQPARQMFFPHETSEFIEMIKSLPSVTDTSNGVTSYA